MNEDDGTQYQVPLPKAKALLDAAARTRLLHLSNLSLTVIPADVFKLGSVCLGLLLPSYYSILMLEFSTFVQS